MIYLLRLGILLVVIGSLYHLQVVFNTFELNNHYIGWILALTVELAYISITIGIVEYKKQNKVPIFLNLALLMFFVISVYCNTYYSFSVHLNKKVLVLDDIFEIDFLVLITIILISSSLPFMALVLVNVYSIFANQNNVKRKRKKRIEKNEIEEESEIDEEIKEENEINEIKNENKNNNNSPFISGFFSG